MTDNREDRPLPIAGAVMKLERNMLELARCARTDIPPTIEGVTLASVVGNVASFLVLVDAQYETPIWVPVVVDLDGEPLSEVRDRLAGVAPRLDAPMLH